MRIDPTLAQTYAVREQIGSGGFATVYRGTQVTTGQDVAIKVLRLDRGEKAVEDLDEQIERFRREMRLCAELHHPNIVPLLDFSETTDGGFYAVFAYVPGWNLGDILAAEGTLEPAEALHLMTQVLDAIHSAHERDIIHRDLKPENIMVNATGARRNALILDFGLGTIAGDPGQRNFRRLTVRGEYMGTPSYSAPEQLRGEPATVRSDLYSWGLIVLECLTGELAMGPGTPHEIIHRHLSPDPVAIPLVLEALELGRILRRVTEKDPDLRAGSAAEVLEGILRCAQQPLPSRAELSRSAGAEAITASLTSVTAQPSRAHLSPIFSVPLARNPNFTGREQILSSIDGLLETSGLLAVVALDGMGGVGKSQIALEYAYRNAHHYQTVAWIRAEAPETLVADYCAIGTPLGLPETSDVGDRVEAVRSWLERHDGWLLVFDNATDPAALRPFLPRSHSGHVIVTSRHASWRGLGASLTVEVLDQRDAVEFLLARTGDTNGEAAAELSDELGGLPLALEEAAAYIEATGHSISTYLPHLRSFRRRLLFGDPSATGHESRLRTAWQLSFDHVEREAPRASELLKLCAFLAPDDVPLDLFRAGAEHLPEGLRKDVHDELGFDALIAALRAYSLIKIERDHLAIHRLVQLATRERMSEDERAHWAGTALRMVEAAYPASALAGEVLPASGRLLPHALSTLSHARPYANCSEVSADLLRRTGIYRGALGLHDLASRDVELALALFEKAIPPDEDKISSVLWELAMVLYAIGEPERALEHIDRAVRIIERRSGATSFRLAPPLVTRAWLQRTLGDFEGSLDSATRTLEISEANIGRNDVVGSMSLALMARGNWYANRAREAREYADRAFTLLSVKNLHPMATGTLYNLGQVLFELGDLARAQGCAERALEISEHAYGPNHPFVSANYGVLGAVLLRLGETERARECLDRAIAGGERTSRNLQEDACMSRSELGTLLWRTGDLTGARDQLEHALVDRVCGDPSRARIHAHLCLAAFLYANADLTLARRHCDEALALCEQRFGADHPANLPGLAVLARILRSTGKPDEAHQSLTRALDIAESSELGAHPWHADILEEMGTLLGERGEGPSAHDHFARALTMCERCLGADHESTRRVRARLAGTPD